MIGNLLPPENGDFRIHSVTGGHVICAGTCQIIYGYTRSAGYGFCLDTFDYDEPADLKKVLLQEDFFGGTLYQDRYGKNVLRISESVPCFDSSDRMYDSYHDFYFVSGLSRPAVVYCGGGYDIADIIVYTGITQIKPAYKKAVRESGFLW